MYAEADLSGRDPRLSLSGDDLRQASLTAAPDVARPARAGDGLGLAVGVLGALGLGAVTLISLSNGRTHAGAPPPIEDSTTSPRVDPPLPVVAALAPAPQTAPPPVIVSPPPSPNTVDPNQSRAGPMIIDNTGVEAASGPAPGPGGAAKAENGPLSQDEQFALRAGGDAPPIARASGLADPRTMVVQGTIIPAVLETALNSDLPGYARAIVSRDVRGFRRLQGGDPARQPADRPVQERRRHRPEPGLHRLEPADPARRRLGAAGLAGRRRQRPERPVGQGRPPLRPALRLGDSAVGSLGAGQFAWATARRARW
jgi:hypothetical protein